MHIIDLPLLYEIQSFLGKKGSLYFNKETKKPLLTIRAKKDILFLIDIFNGNFFLTKRKNQFRLWVAAYNKKYNFDIKVIESTFLPSLNNGWISGFTDAEGSFAVYAVKAGKKKDRFKIIQRYILSQKDSKEELLFITSLLKGYVEKSKRCDRLVVNYSQLGIVICYLETFSLRSSKQKSFKLWKQIWLYRKKSKNITTILLKKISDLWKKRKV